MDPVALTSPSSNSSLSHAHTSPAGDLARPGSLTPPKGDQVDPVAPVGPSFSLSPAHTSPTGDLAHPEHPLRVTRWTLLLWSGLPLTLALHAHVTDSQFEKILIELYHSPTHAPVGDSDPEAMDTPCPQRELGGTARGYAKGFICH